MKIIFITGNEHKAREAKAILKEHDVVTLDLDVPEIQSLDPREIIREKLLAAKAKMKGREKDAALLVEDCSLWIGETGLPGPFIKWFNTALGREGLVTFAKAFNATTARVELNVGVLLPGEAEPRFFTGVVHGKIVAPRGEFGFQFGFDPVFQPDGHEQTYAAMRPEEKNAMSHRKLALEALHEFLSQ